MSTLPPGVPPFPSFVPPPLPPGWTEHQAPGGQTYYHNASTNQSTYTRPLPGVPFSVPGGIPFIPPGSIIPGASVPKEKKKKERPLSKTPVPGTSWLRVKTTEGNVFWTHKERKESVWEVPEEIRELAEAMEREDKEKETREVEAKVQQKLEGREREADEIKKKEREEVERVMEEVKDAVAAGKRKAGEPAEGEKDGGHKKPRVEEEEEEEKEGGQDEQWQREIADEMVAEVEAEEGDSNAQLPQEANDAEHGLPSDEQDSRQDSTVSSDNTNKTQPFFKVPDRVDLSLEEAKALFKTLLQEKNISPLHPWDTSLPLFITDPRYVLLPSVSARREAFDEYCRDAARAQRAAKAAALKDESERAGMAEADKDKEAYAKLLREEVTSTRTTWHEFRRKWKKDRRFFGWAGDREKERAFRDWVRDLADVKRKQAEKAEREFFQLLREHKEVKPGDVWKEAKRNINPKDPRYDAVGSSSLREELFATYVKTVESSGTGDTPAQPDQDPTQRKRGEPQEYDDDATRRKQRAERAERGLREREEKIRHERAGLERELGRTRGAVGREEGERQFVTLLTDAVRDPQANWDTTVPSLSHDPRFVLCALPLPVQRGLFSKHVARLREKHLAGLHALFSAHAPRLSTRWHELDDSARKAVKGSVAVGKLGLSDLELDPDLDDRTVQRGGEHALEAEFERWQRTRNTDARQAFDVLLSENAFLEFWGRMGKASGDGVGGNTSVPDEGEEEEEGEGGGGRADLKKLAQAIDTGEIEKVLKNDSRWTAFDHVPDQRERWLRDYIERLAAPKLSVHIPDKDRT